MSRPNRHSRQFSSSDDDENNSHPSSAAASHRRSQRGSLDQDEDNPRSSRRRDDDENDNDHDHDDHDEDDDDDNNDSRPSSSTSSQPNNGGSSTRRKNKKNSDKSAENKRTEILVDRTVIHRDLIRRAVHKELHTYYDAQSVPHQNDIDLRDISELVLSFCNIYQIDNLTGFEHRLTKLQLDNNIIEKIENLSHLVNLTWLDLSFNKIKKIEGLEKLTKLTDLSLFDNEISTIEGLDSLVNLKVLSLGNNQIKDLAQIRDLRKFKNLRLLNLKGNPVCAHDDYHTTVFAYLTTLKYLDYVVIEPSQFARARDAKLEEVLLLEGKEKEAEAERIKNEQKEEEHLLLTQANLEGLSTLFEDMLKADAEYPKIRILPRFKKEILAPYEAIFNSTIKEFSDGILDRHKLKIAERKAFEDVRKQVCLHAEKESVALIEKYQHLKKKAFSHYFDSLDHGTPDANLLHNLRYKLNILVDKLMDIEMLLVERMDLILNEFEKSYLKLINENVLKINSCFRALLDHCNQYTEALYGHTHYLLEKFQKDDMAALFPVSRSSIEDEEGNHELDVKAILADKDLLNNAVSTSHENHEAKISQKEDEVREREEGGGKKLVQSFRKTEYQRNRKRVAEIHELRLREEAAIEEELEQEEVEED